MQTQIEVDAPKRVARGMPTPVLPAVLAVALIAAGLLGLDRWVYSATLAFNTLDPLDRDGYQQTKWFWNAVRFPVNIFGALLIFFVLMLLHRRGGWVALRGLVSVTAAGAATWAIQSLTGRIRPNQAESHLTFLGPAAGLDPVAPVCFPSGEATMGFAMATFLARIAPQYAALFFIGAVLASLARLVQGAHYLSDVTAGAVVGIVVTRAALRVLEPLEPALERVLRSLWPLPRETTASAARS